jgi:hypothetical protein
VFNYSLKIDTWICTKFGYAYSLRSGRDFRKVKTLEKLSWVQVLVWESPVAQELSMIEQRQEQSYLFQRRFYQATFWCTARNGKITVWIEDQNQRQILLTLMKIQEKSLHILEGKEKWNRKVLLQVMAVSVILGITQICIMWRWVVIQWVLIQ